MDAPTTPSADNGVPGEGGWFSPRRPVGERRSGAAWERTPPALTPADTVPPGRGVPARRAALPSTARVLSVPEAASAAGTVPDAVLIRRTMAAIAPVADEFTAYFYALLFVRYPGLRAMFPAAMDVPRARLLKALLTVAELIDDTPALVGHLQALGRSHRKYGARAEYYPVVGVCLLGALGAYAGAAWTTETETAWARAYTACSQVMIDAAAVDAQQAPAWWQAEIVAHQPLTPAVTAVTVRPGQPYPFLAGQYAEVETPWWPRVWRSYSFASVPRSDGLLAFHVKAVPAGWVSNALVHRARPGDVVRLGPPTGSMTVDHTTDRGIVCVAGGVGIAPVKAIVEDIAEHGGQRPVEVVYGARTEQDLYELGNLRRLQQRHAWLEIRPVTDRNGVHQLPHAVRAYGPWDDYDGYVAGPPGLIRSALSALADNGVPAQRIRHDPAEERGGTRE
jgi:NAD(P)H-flavin reductase/hemoglobin-like flavoprotein